MTQAEELRRLKRWLHVDHETRFVSYVFGLSQYVDGEHVVLRPPTQAAIGDAIGCTREQANRISLRLEKAGLIAYRRSRAVMVLSRELVARAEAWERAA